MNNDMYNFADTRKMRGAWLVLLVNTADVDYLSRPEKLFVCRQIRKLQENFPCKSCKQHFLDYILESPPEFAIDKKDGLFTWIVNLMNNINRRIGKPQYNYKIMYALFHNGGIEPCSENCGDQPQISDTYINKTTSFTRR